MQNAGILLAVLLWVLGCGCSTTLQPETARTIRYRVPTVEYQEAPAPVYSTPLPANTNVLIRGDASVTTGSVTLAWDSSPDPDVSGYALHEGPASGHYTNRVDVGAVNQARMTGLLPGPHYFVATAYTAAGLESLPSNEVSYTVLLRMISVWAESAPSPEGPWASVTNWPALTFSSASADQFFRLRIR